MAKAKDAFRTISEVAEWLDTPTHVLRFWESKFTQIKPVKGAGGRRYYRPTDMDLLGGIKQLLHEDGLTIKGTQKLLREKGVKHVAGLGQSMSAASATKPPEPKPAAQAPQPPKERKVAPVTSQPPHQDALPFDAPDTDVPKAPDIPPQTETPVTSARVIGRAPVDTKGLQARAAQIAPLLARLEELRARMHG